MNKSKLFIENPLKQKSCGFDNADISLRFKNE